MKITNRKRLTRPHEFHLGKALRLIWSSTPGWTAASVAFVIIQGVLPLLTLYLMKLIVDAVAAGITAPEPAEAFRHVALLIAVAGGVTLLNALINSIAGVVREQQTQIVSDFMNNTIHAKSVEVDLEYYENSKYYDTLHRAQQEGPHRPGSVVNGLVQVGQNGISLIVIAGLLLSFHWVVTVILFIIVVPGILIRIKHSHHRYDWQRYRTPNERRAMYYHWILTGEPFAKEMRLFDLGALFMKRFRELRLLLRKERLTIAIRYAVTEMVSQIFIACAVVGTYLFVAYRTVQGLITIGDLVMYYQAFQRGQNYLKTVLNNLASLYEDNLFLNNLFEFLEMKPKLVKPAQPQPFPRPIENSIMLEHVTFKYSSGYQTVLEDISLTINPGEVIALIGENGSGKTTLIKLLCRLYDPTDGVIRIDGTDLRMFNTEDVQREIGVIFQDYVRYYQTARENIWFGNTALPSDHKNVLYAAQCSGADQVVAKLPNGYETDLGKLFDNGEELSVGEWQKFALARAFLRNAQIMILDEPSSSMDAKTEHRVFQDFRQLCCGKTAILISHRFSTVRMADRIYVLHKGRIVESGTHKELLRLSGIYSRMFRMQAEAYQ